jgi:nucleotide-binding universal stress UspA family protein
MNLRRILVPVDYSKESEHALAFAVGFAEQFGAELVVIHVQYIPADVYPYTLYITDKVRQDIRAREQERLESWCSERGKGGANLRTLVEIGEARSLLPDLARREDVDLVVIGTRGSSGLRHLVLGSTAERVVRLAPCPVITVPG